MKRLLRLAYPTEAELRRLVAREMDPRRARDFEPLHLGAVPTAVALVLVLICGIAVAPLRILRRLIVR